MSDDGRGRTDFDEDGPTLPESRPSTPSTLDAEGRLAIGARLGRYQIEELLGEGAMGAVYRAHRSDLDAPFAIKIMSRAIAKIPGAAERFTREARAAARVRHDHVVRVVDTGITGDLPYLVMEYLDGRSLEDALEGGPLTPSAAIAVILPVIAATDAAHRVGIIHRDLKPANVFLSDGPVENAAVKVVDFGISKMEGQDAQITQTGEFVGTPGYAAPEQLKSSRDVGPAADQYSIGVMLYETLSGTFPFEAGSSFEIIHKVLSGEAKPLSDAAPGLPDALITIVERAMFITPEARHPSLVALGHALLSFADAGTRARWERVFGPVAIEQDPSPTPSPARPRRMAVVAAVVGVAGIVATVWALSGTGGSEPPTIEREVPAAADAFDEATAEQTGEPLRLGVSVDITHERLANDYAPLAEHLEGALARPVELVTLQSYDRIGRGLGGGEIDVGWLPPYDYVRAHDAGTALVLLARPVEGGDRTSYQGIIVARAEDGAPSSLAALAGGTFCYINPTSSSGYLYPRVLLEQNDLEPDTMFSSTRFVDSHSALLPALRDGLCDAGATYAGMLYEAEERVGLSPTDFTILASTGPIPYGPYVARAGLGDETIDALGAALLALAPASDAADSVFDHSAAIRGFEAASDSDYDVLRVVRAEAVD